MPAILAMLLGGLINIVGTMAGRVLVALGIGVVSYTGMQALTGQLVNSIVMAFGSLPSQVLAIVYMLKLGQAIGIIIAATSARMVINGVTSDGFKRFVLR